MKKYENRENQRFSFSPKRSNDELLINRDAQKYALKNHQNTQYICAEILEYVVKNLRKIS